MNAIRPKRSKELRARVDQELHDRMKARATGTKVSVVVRTALEVYDAVMRVLEAQRA